MSHESDAEFDALEDKVEELAKAQAPAPAHHDPSQAFDPARNEADFESLVSDALDELPDEVIKELADVPIVVSDGGAAAHAYGMYTGPNVLHNTRRMGGSGMASTFFGGPPDRSQILIFRDTLVRDYGHDPRLLRAQVRETVRHEVGHFLGFDEAGLQRLGL